MAATPHPAEAPAEAADQDLLTVMTYNTYLLRVIVGVAIDTRPNLAVRAEKIAEWFKTLRAEDVPDVLVLQEIYSDEGEELVDWLCSKDFSRNHHSICPMPKFWTCSQDSPFEIATSCVNPTVYLNPVKTGGVVVLIKKGHQLLSVEDIEYNDCAGEECYTQLGFWAVHFRKGAQKYWFFGTHAIAYENPEYIELRQKQFRQMRAYIDAKVEPGARIAIAGDMNIFTGPYTDEHGTKHTPTELMPMLRSLGGSANAPMMSGDLVPMGFWLPLDANVTASADPELNHFISHIPSEVRLGHQQFDWVLAPGPGDVFVTPHSMRYQIVPVKSDVCYDSEQPGAEQWAFADDLSDHYAVFAEIRWIETAPTCSVVQGHRGSNKTLPAGPDCTRPGKLDEATGLWDLTEVYDGQSTFNFSGLGHAKCCCPESYTGPCRMVVEDSRPDCTQGFFSMGEKSCSCLVGEGWKSHSQTTLGKCLVLK